MKALLLKTLSFVVLFVTLVSCNDLQKDEEPEGITPVTASEEVSSFFKEYLPEHSSSKSDSGFSFKDDSECLVVNSMDEFKRVAPDSVVLPFIDFDKYTLVIWQILMGDAGYQYERQFLYIDDNSSILNVVYKRLHGFFAQQIQYFRRWGIYEKISDEVVSVKVNVI